MRSRTTSVDANEQFGFRLRNGVIEMQLGAGNWQALTDSGTLTVTRFSVTPTVQQIALPDFCTLPCPAGSSTCPPRLQVRSLALLIARPLGARAGARARRCAARCGCATTCCVGACPV